MKTLTEICDAIEKLKEQPHGMAELLLDMGIKYARMSEIYKDLRQAKRNYWKDHKVAGTSDKAVEIEWQCTEEGEKEMRATLELKSLEKLMSNAKTYLRHMENESRNQY